jgi:hypothetical protein
LGIPSPCERQRRRRLFGGFSGALAFGFGKQAPGSWGFRILRIQSPQAKTGSPEPSVGLKNALFLLISFFSSLRPFFFALFAPLREIPFLHPFDYKLMS